MKPASWLTQRNVEKTDLHIVCRGQLNREVRKPKARDNSLEVNVISRMNLIRVPHILLRLSAYLKISPKYPGP